MKRVTNAQLENMVERINTLLANQDSDKRIELGGSYGKTSIDQTNVEYQKRHCLERTLYMSTKSDCYYYLDAMLNALSMVKEAA